MVADAYYNTSYSGCGLYNHPDHYSIQHELFHVDQFADDPTHAHNQYGVTCQSDPSYQLSPYTKTINAADYAANMSCPSGTPTGLLQVRFSWLAFGGSYAHCWAYGTAASMQTSGGPVFPSDEYFWVRNHPQS